MAARSLTITLIFSLVILPIMGAFSAERLKLSSTTSTDNTGLLSYLLPVFEDRTGIHVDVIAVGTGKALKLAENGDVDITLVHAPSREKAFVEAGHGVNHRQVMANYFIIAGPKNDPAGVRSATEAAQAFEMIATSKTPFASRGDDSGTHIKEKVIWTEALGKIPQGESWYLESGKGMGETLVIADEKRGYTITDLGSFLKFADKIDLTAVFNRSSPLLYNPYGIMAVNPARHPHIKYLFTPLAVPESR
jgi:tungstate transport system substrate-binding protein